MVTRVLAAGQEDEEIRKSEILCLNEQDVKKKELLKATPLEDQLKNVIQIKISLTYKIHHGHHIYYIYYV